MRASATPRLCHPSGVRAHLGPYPVVSPRTGYYLAMPPASPAVPGGNLTSAPVAWSDLGSGIEGIRAGERPGFGEEVPFDAVEEGGPGEVAATDHEECAVGVVDLPGLGMEGACPGFLKFPEAGLELAALLARGDGPSVECAERVGIGDEEVIAGQEPDVCAARKGFKEGGSDQFETGGLDKGGEDVGGTGLGEPPPELVPERGLSGGEPERRGGRRFWSEIVGLGRDHMANAAPGIGDVAGIPRDDMDMDMGDGLAGGGAGIEPDVVAVGFGGEGGVEVVFDGVDEIEEGGLFGGSGVEPGGDEPARDDEGVSRGDGESVGERKGEGVGGDPGGGLGVEERGTWIGHGGIGEDGTGRVCRGIAERMCGGGGAGSPRMAGLLFDPQMVLSGS